MTMIPSYASARRLAAVRCPPTNCQIICSGPPFPAGLSARMLASVKEADSVAVQGPPLRVPGEQNAPLGRWRHRPAGGRRLLRHLLLVRDFLWLPDFLPRALVAACAAQSINVSAVSSYTYSYLFATGRASLCVAGLKLLMRATPDHARPHR